MSVPQGFQGGQGQPGSGSDNPGDSQGQPQGGTGSQGASGSEWVSKSDFDSLSQKLDEVIADNVRYRNERRTGKATGNSNSGTEGNSGNGSSQGNNGDGVDTKLATLTMQLQQANFRGDISAAATRAGAVYPSDVYRFLSMDDVPTDDLGNVKPGDADKALANLKKQYPALFGTVVQGGADGGAGNGSGNSNPNDFSARLRSEIRGRN